MQHPAVHCQFSTLQLSTRDRSGSTCRGITMQYLATDEAVIKGEEGLKSLERERER